MYSKSRSIGGKSISILFLIVLFNVFSFTRLYGWGGGNHTLISKAAIQLLPQWEVSMLGSAADSLVERYCLYPDWYRNYINKKDSAAIARLKPYMQLPLLQDLTKYHRTEDKESEICFYVAATLMHQAVRCFQENSPLEAARYMGPLVHFIEDNACPVHTLDNQLLLELLPKPVSLVPFSLHGDVERPTFLLESPQHQPQLLGANAVEAANAFYGRFLENRRTARAQAVPILQAMYAGKEQDANRGRALAAAAAAKLTADVIHTVCTISKQTK